MNDELAPVQFPPHSLSCILRHCLLRNLLEDLGKERGKKGKKGSLREKAVKKLRIQKVDRLLSAFLSQVFHKFASSLPGDFFSLIIEDHAKQATW